MPLFLGSLSSRCDATFASVDAQLIAVSASDNAGDLGDRLGVLIVKNSSGGPLDVTLPGVPDPFGRTVPQVTTIPDGSRGLIGIGSSVLLGAPIQVEFSATTGVTAGAWSLLTDGTAASSYTPIVPDLPEFDDSFEFADGWPGTVADTDPTPTFTTATIDDGFESADGWPGT